MNPAILTKRAYIIKRIRAFFDARGYTEMHTARLVGLPGQEPYLEPFWTEVIKQNGDTHPAALITSPEYAMKRLLAAGMDKIYDLGPCFRNNEPWDVTHDPEFLMLEWYRKNADLASLMHETEEMVRAVSGERFAAPFRRLTVQEAWQQYAQIDLVSLLNDRAAMANACRAHEQPVAENDTWDDLYNKLFLSKVEPHLGAEPTFLYRYPASQAALAARCADDPRFADRVELYIGGIELANGFAELTDAAEQRARFEEEVALRAALGKPTWPLDEAFLRDLPNIQNAVGIAFGIDRFVMLLTGSRSINDVIPVAARERFTR